MFIFILLNLFISYSLKTESTFRIILVSDISWYIGLFLITGSSIATWFKHKKFPYKYRYDVFATGAVLVWISYWPPFFRPDSPIFETFPLYFAFMTALFSIFFITQKENIDSDSIKFLQWLSDSGRFNPMLIMIAVIISLALPKQFLLFPVTITLLIMRFALASCLNNE